MLLCGLSLLGLTACDIDSGDETVRTIGVALSGLYTNGGGRIVSPSNTGNAVTSLNLVQTGDRLEAVDNNGQIFRGTVGAVVDTQASFNMTGSTTAGNEAVIAGTFTVNGTQATMSGTWAEPALFGSVSASATVGGLIDVGNPGDGSGSSLSLSSNPGGINDSLSVNSSRTYTASGGTAPYSWSVATSSRGSLSSSSGSSVTYTASSSAGNQTVTLRDSTASTATASFTQN